MKKYLITGVSRGLGLEIAKTVAEGGGFVFGVSRTITPELEALAGAFPNAVKLLQFDLADTRAVKDKIFAEFVGLSTKLDGYVNNAAVAYDDLATNIDEDKLGRMYAVNVFSPMIAAKYAIRNFILHETRGSIVHISSVCAKTGYKGLSMYASTKGAIEAFSKGIAREWGSRGIRSNAVAAGFMQTAMSASLGAEKMEKIISRSCLKAPVSPKSVAETVAFLLSEKSESITGETISVDCGAV